MGDGVVIGGRSFFARTLRDSKIPDHNSVSVAPQADGIAPGFGTEPIRTVDLPSFFTAQYQHSVVVVGLCVRRRFGVRCGGEIGHSRGRDDRAEEAFAEHGLRPP